MKNVNRILKLLALGLALVLCLGFLAACGKDQNPPVSSGEETAPDAEVINVAVIQGPTGVGMASLIFTIVNGSSSFQVQFKRHLLCEAFPGHFLHLTPGM